MILLAEPKDIKEIKGAANDCWNITLSDDEVDAIIQNNRSYAGEVYKWGATDTEVVESLGRILKEMGK